MTTTGYGVACAFSVLVAVSTPLLHETAGFPACSWQEHSRSALPAVHHLRQVCSPPPSLALHLPQLAAAVTSLAVMAELVADMPSGVTWRWWQIVVIACSSASALAALLVLTVQVRPRNFCFCRCIHQARILRMRCSVAGRSTGPHNRRAPARGGADSAGLPRATGAGSSQCRT